jgi:uncharacterized membrane protein (UPF0127 family)
MQDGPASLTSGTLTVWNATRSAFLVEHGRSALTFWSRGKGLLGTSSLPAGDGLLIQPCHSIHSFGMQYLFDAVFVDRHGKVLHTISRMKANRLSRHVFRAQAVIEMPAGTIESTGTKNGDTLRIKR